MRPSPGSAALWGIVGLLVFSADAPARAIPAPLPDHPGNVFLAGEQVTVLLPVLDLATWRVTDYDGKVVAEGKTTSGRALLGPLPVGWYELHWSDTERAAFAVLEPLKAPTPPTSPIGIDVAMAWFCKEPRMPAVANLCTLAGINWVRDRLSWGEVEPKRGQFAPAGATRYDASARIQSAAGLRVLQVNHSSPAWANPDHKRFPTDLRDAYRFYREMARRWSGQVVAFEPWNEADIDAFGGHTGGEMASLQKAAYLGLKTGNAGTTACQNVFATPTAAILKDLADNEVWPYFDTFNLHHYAAPDRYPKIYADFRAVSAGRPLWVTEFSLPVQWSGDEKLKEPSPSDLRVQAERLPQVFAAALHEGPQAAFYFMLPHYVEGKTQFGVLGPDLTPRPAFVALAAVGRLLADARPLGRVKDAPANVRAFWFRARPDGADREVLVAWSASGSADAPKTPPAEAVYDHLGRRIAPAAALPKLTAAPVLAVFPCGTVDRSLLDPPPPALPRLDGTPSPVVLQAAWPKERTALNRSAYKLAGDKPEMLPVFAYNFSDAPVEGDLAVAAPTGWKIDGPKHVKLAPMDRAELALTIDASAGGPAMVETVRITGDFGAAGRPVLSLRLAPQANLANPASAVPLPEACQAARWTPSITGGGRLEIAPGEKALACDARFVGGDRWVYPVLELRPAERPPAGCIGVAATITLEEGDGVFRAIFVEENQSAYVAAFLVKPERGKPVETAAFFEDANYGEGWSKPDPNGRLDAGEIRFLKIGCNAAAADRIRYRVENVRWLLRK